MATSSILCCHCRSSISAPKPSLPSPRRSWDRRLGFRCSSSKFPQFEFDEKKECSFGLKECAFSIALAIGLFTGVPQFSLAAHASPAPVLPDLAVLISGPPIKDPGALLRYALPVDNKAIREVQKPLEDITDSLKIAGVKALDSVERNLRQASRALSQGKAMILAGVAESKKADGQELLDKLSVGMEEFQRIVEERNRDAVAPKQKELLQYVGARPQRTERMASEAEFGRHIVKLMKLARRAWTAYCVNQLCSHFFLYWQLNLDMSEPPPSYTFHYMAI